MILAHLRPIWCERWEFAPFMLGIVFLGLPHGALDHLVPLRLTHRSLTFRYLSVFVMGYGGLAGLYLLFWHLSPLLALAVFLLLSWLHWGQGDAYFLTRFAAQPAPAALAGRLLVWAVRGGLPILLPALAFPPIFTQVTQGILGWYGDIGGWQMGGEIRIGGLALLGLITGLYLWQSWHLSHKTFALDLWEVSLLLAYFLAVPPILAVGVYFCVWHSSRHIARLALLEPTEGKSLGWKLTQNAWQAVPMTVGALCLLGAMFVSQRRANVSTGDFVYLYLSLIAALTFPHFLLVLWMDRKELRENCSDPIAVGSGGLNVGDGF